MTISHVMACVHYRHWETTERTEVGWITFGGMFLVCQ